MKKTIQTLIFIFLIAIAVGQNNKDYSQYHDNILAIEECNSRGSFDSSLTLYSVLFKKYNRIMARDAYNACQIAALKKHKLFSDFFFLCGKTGIAKSRLLNNSLIQAQYVTDSIKLTALYIEGTKEFSKQIDNALRIEMIRRADNEQKSKGKENYYKVCTDNFNRILELAKQGKFPGESLIGTSEDIECIILPTLCHYPYSCNKLEPYLKNALNEGNITPIAFIYLYGFNQTRRSILYTPNIPIDTINFKISFNLPFGQQSYDFDEVNKQRRINKIISMSVEKSLKELNYKYNLDYLIGY